MAEAQERQPKVTKLGLIGAGSMGGALIRGLLASGWTNKDNLVFYDPDPQRRAEMAQLGVRAARDNPEVMQCPVVVLAVKPQVLPEVLAEIRDFTSPRQVVISVVAGAALKLLEEALPRCRVIRAMPNTPLMVQAGMTALAPGSRAAPEDVALALRLFRAVGRAEVVAESHLDIITALSGSGPAFIAVFLEALADGAVKMGLPRSQALEFAAQTLLGTARLILEKNLHPGLLKDLVASPGGTTIHGLFALEQGAFRAAVMGAVEAAARRAEELGRR